MVRWVAGWMDGQMGKLTTCFQRQFYKGMEGEHQTGKSSSLEKGAIGVNRDVCIICIV